MRLHKPNPPPTARCRCPAWAAQRRSRHGRPEAAHAQPSAGAEALGELAVRVEGLHMSFKTLAGTKQVLQGVDLEIPRGCFHMLLGPNGCGKSTLLRVLAGLFRPDSGSVAVLPPYAFVFQNPDHQVVMPTVAADVAFGLGRYDLDERAVQEAVQHSLEQVGLAGLAERPTSSLSGGQKQRVAIAGALAESPNVLLMDELTTFLDYEDQLNVLQCVRAIVDGAPAPAAAAPVPVGVVADNGANGAAAPSGGSQATGGGREGGDQQQQQQQAQARVTALWVTHRLEELDYADSVSYMDGGRIVFSGSPEEMRSFMRRLGAHV